jgi:pimeloyl-ACP methyl ester carboxylesterase
MRRFVVLVGAASAGALAWSLARARGPARPAPVTGIFSNGMAYTRLGTGSKSLLFIPGGPGNQAPGGLTARMLARRFRPFVESGYTVWSVARKRGMPKGHTMADIAADYAGMIADEFGGRVDLVVGISYGGMVGFYLAADHPDRFGHIAIVVAGHTVGERGKALDYEFARHLSEGRPGEAMATMLRELAPPWLGSKLAGPLGALVGRLAFGETHPEFASDVLVEAEAEVACDARNVLPRVSVPVLLVCGDRDLYFPKAVYEETARLIPDCTLRMYAGKGHMGAVSDGRLAQDVLDFVGRHPRAAREEAVSEAVSDPVLAGA